MRESCRKCGVVNEIFMNTCDKPGCIVVHNTPTIFCSGCKAVMHSGWDMGSH